MTAYTQAHSYRMRLTRLTIKNFRNLDGVDIPLVGGPVVVGENRVGKSNLVHAIRLVLDSSLSSKARWLRTEDFSEHLGLDPIGDGAEIRISVEIEDFGEDGGLMAALRHAIVSGDPVRRRRVRRLAAPDALERSALRPRAR
jgi:putative ATP-dependent endonuclease of the OLD family